MPITCRALRNEAEHIELAYTLPSVNVLLNAVLRRANR
jgi:hypothetical protein